MGFVHASVVTRPVDTFEPISKTPEPLIHRPRSADTGAMPFEFVLPYFVLWATLMRGLLVAAKILPPICRRCGLDLERRRLGDPVCRCVHDAA